MWDHHAVLALRPACSGTDAMDDGPSIRTASLIYDFDTTLDLPHDAQRRYLFCTCFTIVSPLGDPRYPNIPWLGRVAPASGGVGP